MLSHKLNNENGLNCFLLISTVMPPPAPRCASYGWAVILKLPNPQTRYYHHNRHLRNCLPARVLVQHDCLAVLKEQQWPHETKQGKRPTTAAQRGTGRESGPGLLFWALVVWPPAFGPSPFKASRARSLK